MSNKGFSLIEVLVVISITALVSTFLIFNFSRARLLLNETANIVAADVRLAQAKTLSGTRYEDTPRCGYGLTDESGDNSTYYTYVGPDASIVNCDSVNKKYNQGEDTIIITGRLLDSISLEFKSPAFKDIFFEPPDSAVYIDGFFVAPNGPPEKLIIGQKGKDCNQGQCKSVCVYPSGRIEIKNGDSC